MGFSSQQYKRGKQERQWKIHPVWRGIGCILLLLVPIMSWYIATIILQSNAKTLLPYQLTNVFVIPTVNISAIDQLIIQVNHYFKNVNFVFGQLFLTIIFSVIGFGIIALIYSILYRVAGPPRYGPFDVPPNSV